MRELTGTPFDEWRQTGPNVVALYGDAGDETCGMFLVPIGSDGDQVTVIASAEQGWDHVSVSHHKRCPSWDTMSRIKRLFFLDDEWAVEFHPPPRDNISLHDKCLHLWRPNDGTALHVPPEILVAPPGSPRR